MSFFRKNRYLRKLSDAKKQARKNIFLSVLITTLVMAAFWLYCPPRFVETNDDVVMASILYGYNGEYDGHMYFINICLGAVLEVCVRLLPMVPWYTVAQVGTIYISYMVITYLLLQQFKGCRSIFPIVTMFTFFGYESFCSLQFTKTAAIGVIGGLLLAFYAVENGSKWPTYLLACLLTLMGSCFRFSVFEMMLALFFIIGLYMVIMNLKNRDWTAILRLCVPFVVIIGVCFACHFVNRYHYTNHPTWGTFAENNVTRAELSDKGFPEYAENIELYTKLNITENDYHLYAVGNYADPELYTPEVISALAEAKPPKVINKAFFAGFLSTIGRALINYSFFPAVAIAVLLALLSIEKANKAQIFILIYEAALFAAVQVYFYYSNRYLQRRVDVGIMLALYLILFLYSIGAEAIVPSKAKTGILLSLSLMITTVPYHLTKYEDSKEQRNAAKATQVYELIASDQEHFYLHPNSWPVFADKMWDVFTVEPFGCGNNRSILGTWRSQIPPIREKWERAGISNPYRDMVDNSDILLLCTSGTSKDQVLTHVQEHYNAAANAYMVKTIEQTYQVYRVSSTEVPAIDTHRAIDGSDFLTFDMTYDSGSSSISGYIYEEGKNSYASNIYLGITGEDNIERLYYATQYDGAEHNDYMNGSYGYFYCEISLPTSGTVKLYLENEDGLYYVQTTPFDLLTARYHADIHTIDLLPYLIDTYDCEATKTEAGLLISTTGSDPQLSFSVPELNGCNVAGAIIEMDAETPSVAQLFVATSEAGYSEAQSSTARYGPGTVYSLLENPTGQPISLRFDPTTESGQTLLLRSMQLVLADA